MLTMVDMLVEMGGKRWQKAGRDRVYIPVSLSCELFGLKVAYYNSGNVSSATLRGVKISNGLAREYLLDFAGAYYDVTANKFFGACTEVVDFFRARLAAATQP